MPCKLNFVLDKNQPELKPTVKRKYQFIISTLNRFFVALILSSAVAYFFINILLTSDISNKGVWSISIFDIFHGRNTITVDTEFTNGISDKFLKVITTQNPKTIQFSGYFSDIATTRPNERASNGPQRTLKNMSKYIQSQSCKIPQLNPRDSSIVHLIEKYPDPNCTKKHDSLFESGIDSILTKSKAFFTSKRIHKDCCYRVISRAYYPNGDDAQPGDDKLNEILSKKCFPITKNQTKIPPDHEFILVYCKIYNRAEGINKPKNLTVVDVIAFVPLKPLLEKRISKIEKNKKLGSKTRVNLVVLGLDAVSHLNFFRVMPKVEEYLMKNLSALRMNGYSKIGANTIPNLAAVLTSWNLKEVETRCRNKMQLFFDDCPFLWNNFSAEGYRTSYVEDSTYWTFRKNGFKNPPTDYYLKPFVRMTERHIAHHKMAFSKWCYGSKLTIEVFLNYMKKFATTMSQHDKRFFQWIWTTSITHDYLNAGQISEPSLLSTLKWYEKEGHFNNTVFVLMSDHGIRFGPIRSFRQGKIEENMPLIYFVLPKWFKKKYKSAIRNMRENQDRLTSPYDVYETFKDILYLENIEEKSLTKRKVELIRQEKNKKVPRGISMFLPVPKSRTCKMAEIPQHFCICHNAVKTDIKSAVVKQAANYAVYTLNSLIANHSKCAYLTLSTVFNAYIVNSQFGVAKDEKIFEISFSTSPGDAVFDTTAIKNVKLGKWTISGDISRTNVYGNQSYCVDDKLIKNYCYCVESK